MGGGQSAAAGGDGGATDACDHTPIFSCFDALGDDDAARDLASKYKEQVAGMFHRQSVPSGASIFDHNVGRRDLVIVERGELHMVSCHGEKKASDRPLIKKIVQGEMMGMMELVRNVEQDRDPNTMEFPVDVLARAGKVHLLVLSQADYLGKLVDVTDGDERAAAAKLFVENLRVLTRNSIIAWLRQVVVLSDLGEEGLELLAEVAHFRSLPARPPRGTFTGGRRLQLWRGRFRRARRERPRGTTEARGRDGNRGGGRDAGRFEESPSPLPRRRTT